MAESVSAALGIVPAASAVLVEARSSVGLITFGSTSVTGSFQGRVVEDRLDVAGLVAASAIVPVASLQSGSPLYDNELRTRLNERRFPEIAAELRSVTDLGSGRYSLEGDLTIHGTTRPQECTASVDVAEGDDDRLSLVVTGTATVDMRDYDIALPNVLMLRIFPDVTVRFRFTAATHDTTTEVAH